MKRLTICNCLFCLTIVFCLSSCHKEPTEHILHESYQLDSTNQVLKHQIQGHINRMIKTVIDNGARLEDMEELEKLKTARSNVDSLLNIIEIGQKAFLSGKEDVDIKDPAIDIPELKRKFEQLAFWEEANCGTNRIAFDSLGFSSYDSPGWDYVGLTKMESVLLDEVFCLIDYHFSRVGMADLSFNNLPYATDGTGHDLETLNLDWSDESYEFIIENPFQNVKANPVSTFGLDIDDASYTNIRRYLNHGTLPPRDVVRLEEMVNHFDYNYPEPDKANPIVLDTEYGSCPWNSKHKLLRIGLKSRDILLDTPYEALPANNLVFLIDVSGSMDEVNKLPLVKSSLKLLTSKLRPIDRVSIVVYASQTGVILEPTSGDNKSTIIKAIDGLDAEGSTSGGIGIKKAYQLAQQHFIEGGNNRVIIATDGDFNVGISSEGGLYDLIKNYRNSGVFLTVLGFGMGNYKDSMLRTLSNYGNGNYAYIDTFQQAKNVFEIGFTGTLYTVAKDVKLQTEFNPEYVQGYRLLGYEDRILATEDYANDEVDAGDMGSGHSMTAFYEIIPVGASSEFIKDVPDLKYQQLNKNSGIKELATVRFRYKDPEKYSSEEVVSTISPITEEGVSTDFELASSVIEFGMLLRNSSYRRDANYERILERLATNLNGHVDEENWIEFNEIVTIASRLDLAR